MDKELYDHMLSDEHRHLAGKIKTARTVIHVAIMFGTLPAIGQDSLRSMKIGN